MKNKLQLIRQIIKEETSKFVKKKKLLEEKSTLIKKLNRLNEQWNPDDNYVGNYFVATAPMDEPGETKVHVIGDDQYDEYSEAGWDVEGPYSKKEAEKRMDKIHSSNSQWRYFNENESNEDVNGQKIKLDHIKELIKKSGVRNWSLEASFNDKESSKYGYDVFDVLVVINLGNNSSLRYNIKANQSGEQDSLNIFIKSIIFKDFKNETIIANSGDVEKFMLDNELMPLFIYNNLYDSIKDEIENQSNDEDDEPDYEDYDDRDDDYDSGMSSSQQGHADRSDYAREKMEKGDWDETQAAEFRAGA